MRVLFFQRRIRWGLIFFSGVSYLAISNAFAFSCKPDCTNGMKCIEFKNDSTGGHIKIIRQSDNSEAAQIEAGNHSTHCIELNANYRAESTNHGGSYPFNLYTSQVVTCTDDTGTMLCDFDTAKK